MGGKLGNSLKHLIFGGFGILFDCFSIVAEHVNCLMPKGAFYAMPNISYYLLNNKAGIRNSQQLCQFILEEQKVAIVPGSAFGADNFVRFSYAASMENIREGIARFSAGLKQLLKGIN